MGKLWKRIISKDSVSSFELLLFFAETTNHPREYKKAQIKWVPGINLGCSPNVADTRLFADTFRGFLAAETNISF